jgi:L-2-hydroxyglutarate oxidase LhgO
VWDFVVSIARELRRRHRASVMVIEKEPSPGRHASGRNSGVLHAGVYYKAGTLKARLCVDGNRRMREYCFAKSIPLNENGKVIVARSHEELGVLRELHMRSRSNGVCVELVDTLALKDIEPCAKTVEQALYVKDTAVVNPQRVMEALVADAVEEGIEPDLRNPFLGVHFTRRPEGEVTVGPSALPLLGREQYRGLVGANASDGLAMFKYLLRLFCRNRDHFRSIAWRELTKISRSGFYREAEGLAVGFEPDDLLPGKEPGIRAQLVDTRKAELLSDFVIEPGPRSTHILNAVSPAFTSSVPFAEYVVDMIRYDN